MSKFSIFKFRNPRIFMFNPNARRQYEMDDYDERVECICTIVPIFDDFEQVYGNWFSSSYGPYHMYQYYKMDHFDHLT